MTDMREAVARARLALNNQRQCDETGEMCIVSRQALNEVLAVYDAMQPEIDRRVAEERAKLLERLRDDLNIAIELIQEAKGYEGPKGGPITDHLDAAEGRIDRVLAQFEKETSHEQG